nr:vegetative cell wall protein gp1-like [Aegilops tauschii subsp. strangulata]
MAGPCLLLLVAPAPAHARSLHPLHPHPPARAHTRAVADRDPAAHRPHLPIRRLRPSAAAPGAQLLPARSTSLPVSPRSPSPRARPALAPPSTGIALRRCRPPPLPLWPAPTGAVAPFWAGSPSPRQVCPHPAPLR